jgi:hypothetical protein
MSHIMTILICKLVQLHKSILVVILSDYYELILSTLHVLLLKICWLIIFTAVLLITETDSSALAQSSKVALLL